MDRRGIDQTFPNEELVRFNSLAFRSEHDSAVHEQALGRLIEATPVFPLTVSELKHFCQSVTREMNIAIAEQLTRQVTRPPSPPRQAQQVAIYPLAAAFIAPKTSYFLVKDLQDIGEAGAKHVKDTALGWLIGRRGKQPTSNVFDDSKKVYFPFSSNPNQRRLALLTNDPSVHICVCQGPPGTGKSLTLANLACHLVASGKRVLITSQKDKALNVVDELLRSLDMAELPMTLLRQDQESKRELRQRLDSVDKEKSALETQRQMEQDHRVFTMTAEETLKAEDALGAALHAEHVVASADAALKRAQSFLQRLRLKWGLWEARQAAKRRSIHHSDVPATMATTKRAALLRAALISLRSAAIHRTGTATRQERNTLREFSKILGRSQTSAKNIPVFDRLKKEPERCHALLKILPCWIMAPDDVARLFPLEPGLFDYVLIDEASQLDLCAVVPVLYRAKHALICGDSQQMRAPRLAFTNTQIAAQAWHEHGIGLPRVLRTHL